MKVSVIIPCYNGEEYIGQTIGSVFEQSLPADEIIVVDDGSTDRSPKIAQSFGELVTVLSKGGGGAANARNFGADYATGDAYMFLDADDVLGPDVLESLVQHLEKYPEGVVACQWFRLDKVGDKWVQRPPSCAPLGDNQDYLSGWLTGWYHLPCSILWSRAAYKRTGGWDPRAYVNDDGDLMMRALVDGVNLQITAKGASYYRRMPEEQQSASLSGARFTRKGRESQIYVLHKIAQRLEEKGMLDEYRKPITEAFNNKRTLCLPQYPDLSEVCTDLISQYGEPRHLRILRKFSGQSRRFVHISHRYLGLVRNKLWSSVSDEKQLSGNDSQEKEKEVRFGLPAYYKVTAEGGKGQILKPSRPEVSVIIPAYQTGTIARAVDSILNQTMGNFEVLIVGDGSVEAVEQFTDLRIHYISVSRRAGAPTACNHGLREVRGDFVAFLEPQDEWFSDKIEKQLQLFSNASDSIGLVYSGGKIVDAEGKNSVFRPESKGDVHREFLLRNMIQGLSGVMIRRNVIAGVGFFDESLALSEHDYWLRISRIYDFDFVGKPLFRLNQLRGSEGNPVSKENRTEERREFFEKHRREMKREGVAREFMLEPA